MSGRLRTWVLCLGLTGCSRAPADEAPPTASLAQAVIYGQDDRQEVYEEPDARLRALAEDSTVAMIAASRLERVTRSSLRDAEPTLADAYGLCPGERFLGQPALAECSGVLIDDDLVLTAGHCVTTDGDCMGYRFVFDYYYRGPPLGPRADGGRGASEPEPEPIDDEDIYECRAIAARRHASNETTRIDFAVVQLDRPARDRVPVRIRQGPLPVGERLVTIGCTSGLPFKIDAGARVLHAGTERGEFFVLDSDTFFGSSGSGVFDRAGALAGVIARGGDDYEPAPDAGCKVASRVTAVATRDGGMPLGEEATYAGLAIEALCTAGWPSARLCALDTAELDASLRDGTTAEATEPPGLLEGGTALARARARIAEPASAGCTVARVGGVRGSGPAVVWLLLTVLCCVATRAPRRRPAGPGSPARRFS